MSEQQPTPEQENKLAPEQLWEAYEQTWPAVERAREARDLAYANWIDGAEEQTRIQKIFGEAHGDYERALYVREQAREALDQAEGNN